MKPINFIFYHLLGIHIQSLLVVQGQIFQEFASEIQIFTTVAHYLMASSPGLTARNPKWDRGFYQKACEKMFWISDISAGIGKEEIPGYNLDLSQPK